MTETPIFEAQGITGALLCWRDRVVIRKKGWPYGHKSEKTIPMRSIGAVQWKEPGLLSGYVQIAYSGSSENKGGTFDAATDENTVMFAKRDAPAFARIRDLIQAQVIRGPTPASAPVVKTPTSVADELSKLAALRDQGVLTEDEFAAQKARILG